MTTEVFRRLERVRRARKLSRSAAIQAAVDHWLNTDEHAVNVKRYVESYRRIPEEPQEGEAWVNTEAWGQYQED